MTRPPTTVTSSTPAMTAQIVPPVNAQIEAEIARPRARCRRSPAGSLDGRLVARYGDEVAEPPRRHHHHVSRPVRCSSVGCFPVAAPPSLLPVGCSLASSPARNARASRAGPPRAVSVPLRVVYTALRGWPPTSRCGRSISSWATAASSPPRSDRFPDRRVPQPPRTRRARPGAGARPNATAPTSSWPTTRMATGSPSRCPSPAAPSSSRVLSGDGMSALVGSSLLEKTAAGPEAGRRLVVTTVVSSTLLGEDSHGGRGTVTPRR